MKKEENMEKDSEQQIILVGDRVLIQLKEIQDHTTTEAGLIIPHNQLAETDGGKVTTRPSNQKYYAEGTIIQIANQANDKLMESNKYMFALTPGCEVLVSKQALNSDVFHFYTDRSKPVQDFKGVIAIPHTLIEAIITTPNNN